MQILRLICLQSAANSGLKPRVLEHYKREIIHAYGFQHMVTLHNLEASGLIRTQQSSRPFAVIRRALNLTVDDVNEIHPTDISYVHSVYAPLSVRLIQNAAKPGWKHIADVLNLIPGPLIQETQPLPINLRRRSMFCFVCVCKIERDFEFRYRFSPTFQNIPEIVPTALSTRRRSLWSCLWVAAHLPKYPPLDSSPGQTIVSLSWFSFVELTKQFVFHFHCSSHRLPCSHDQHYQRRDILAVSDGNSPAISSLNPIHVTALFLLLILLCIFEFKFRRSIDHYILLLLSGFGKVLYLGKFRHAFFPFLAVETLYNDDFNRSLIDAMRHHSCTQYLGNLKQRNETICPLLYLFTYPIWI